jgi:hypothetical protein
MFSRTVRHLHEGEVYETDVVLAPAGRWDRRAEAARGEWQAVRFGGLVLALRPVSGRPGVRPRALGVRAHPALPGRYRARHRLGDMLAGTEVDVRAEGDPEAARPPPAGLPAWHTLRACGWVVRIAPVLPRAISKKS